MVLVQVKKKPKPKEKIKEYLWRCDFSPEKFAEYQKRFNMDVHMWLSCFLFLSHIHTHTQIYPGKMSIIHKNKTKT